MTGILQPDAGRVLLKDRYGAKPLEAKPGYVPDSFEMYDRLTGPDLRFWRTCMGRAARRSTLKNTWPSLSWRRPPTRFAATPMHEAGTIIGALIHGPSIWVLDEPMTAGPQECTCSGGDEGLRQEGRSVFFHPRVDVAERLCEIGIIQHGKLIARQSWKS